MTGHRARESRPEPAAPHSRVRPTLRPSAAPGAAIVPGSPLPHTLRGDIEPRFGFDFSQVRVHTDAEAAHSATLLGAEAYTVGRDVFFARDRYAPDTHAGRRLLLHELAHVVQHQGASEQSPDVVAEHDDSERAAERVAEGVPTELRPSAGIHLQRRTPPPAPTTPTLGACQPVQHDDTPTAPWPTLQTGFRARCATAAADAGRQLERAWGDISRGRVPTFHPTPARESIDCACAFGTPTTAAHAAYARLIAAGALSVEYYNHFLSGSGADKIIDVADVIARDRGMRQVLRRSMGQGGNSGTTRINQSDYAVADFQFAFGALDCIQWRVPSPAPHGPMTPTTPVEVSVLDYYEFHPERPGVSQCAHAACVQLVADGSAKNFWMRGTTTVPHSAILA